VAVGLLLLILAVLGLRLHCCTDRARHLAGEWNTQARIAGWRQPVTCGTSVDTRGSGHPAPSDRLRVLVQASAPHADSRNVAARKPGNAVRWGQPG
jgi:hypothetical protein